MSTRLWRAASSGQRSPPAASPSALLSTPQSLPHVRGFISSAFGPDLLSRFLALTLWLLMTVK